MDHRFPDLLPCLGVSFQEGVVNIGSHQYPIVRGNAKEGDKPYPHGNAEVDGMHAEHLTDIDSANREIHEPGFTVQP